LQTQKHLVIGLVVLVGVIAAFWAFWPSPSQTPGPARTTMAPAAATAGPSEEPDTGAKSPSPEAPQPPEPPAPLETQEAERRYDQALRLRQSGRVIEARDAISAALFSGQLDTQHQDEARELASELARQTILSSGAFPGDPYCDYYVVKFGDKLTRIVEELRLYVPHRMIMRINHIDDPRRLRAGQRLKIIRGPFHAIITKSDFTMDLYLQRKGLPRVFIRRFRVGLGQDGSTPTGLWRVAAGEKLIHPVWYPSPNSRYDGPISYGEPDYAFGERGLWIGMEGLDEETKYLTDYGIHSTNDPTSIGQARSEGCIRLVDEDIEFVFAALYEKYSTIEVRR